MTDQYSTCPFCGAKRNPAIRYWQQIFICQTGIDDDGIIFRDEKCYENEIAFLKTALNLAGKATGVK